MKVKTLASQSFLYNVNKEGKEGISLESRIRINSLRNVFGPNEFGVILSGDLEKELRTGKRAKVYSFDDSLYLVENSNEKGVECDLFLPVSFSTLDDPKSLASSGWVKEAMSYLDFFNKKGLIENLVNSKKGTLNEDKINMLDLQKKGINVPQTYHFENLNKLKEFLESNEGAGDYILKHRFGQGGLGTYLLDKSNIDSLSKLDIKEYILQAKEDIENESRIIFFDGEILGSRIIYDRHMPWEEKGKAGRKHLNSEYFPSEYEVSLTKNISKYLGSKLGCMDFIKIKGKKEKLLLEYNGVGTGWGDGVIDPYDLNETIHKKLKEKYL